MKRIRGSGDPSYIALYNSLKDAYEVILRQYKNYKKMRASQFSFKMAIKIPTSFILCPLYGEKGM